MERHVPKHALPEEIEKMPREDKLCKYCGVSYLILHEFQALEEKVQALERELRLCRVASEREHRLQEQLQALSRDLEQSRATGEAQAHRIRESGLQLQSQQDALQDAQEELSRLTQELQAGRASLRACSQRLAEHRRLCTKTRALLSAVKRELSAVRTHLRDGMRDWAALTAQVSLQITSGSNAAATEVRQLQRSLAEAQSSQAGLEAELQGLRPQRDEALGRAQLQQGRCQELQQEVLGLQSQVELLRLQLHQALSERDSAQDVLTAKSKEAEDWQRQLRKLKFESVISDSRHTRLLKEKEDSLMTCQQIYKTLQEELAAKEKQEEHSKASAQLAKNELELTRTLLRQSKDEVAALTRERELMLVSHQRSIEQLQETLRQKVLSDESWREKIEAELAKERARHAEDVEEQSLAFREAAELELKVEKEKHREVIQKYQQEQEALQAQISELVVGPTNELRLQVSALEARLQESQARQAETARSKEQELESLRLVVAECQSRLRKETDSKDAATRALREELEQLMLAHNQLLQRLSQAQEENSLLQETVRRECEERFELTEALGQAKEQLLELELQRLGAGGLAPVPPAPAPGSSLSSPPAPPSARQERSLARPPHAPGLLWPHRSPPSQPLPRPPPARGRTASVTETRQRLTALLRGRLSQR